MNENKQENKRSIEQTIFNLFETIGKLKSDLDKEMTKIEKYVKNREEYNPDLNYIEKTTNDIISLGKELDELYEIRDILKHK